MEYRKIECDGYTEIYDVIIGPDKKEKLIYKHKVYEETDQCGIHKIIEQKNGIKVRLLRQPSQWYKDKMTARAAIEAERKAIEDEKQAIRKKIEDKKKAMAIEEMLTHGEITQEELDKIE